MIEVKGKYATAKIFTDNVDNGAIEQIKQLCSQEFAKGSKIRVMPDVHKGAGCVIGFTADLGDKVIPNIVGVDIGCGMLTVKLGNVDIDFDKLDNTIRKNVPSGKNIHNKKVESFDLIEDLKFIEHLKYKQRIHKSIGTLGGGNHFIEINIDKDNNKYLVIHTGSRNLGTQVADYYQNKAINLAKGHKQFLVKKQEIIKRYKETNRASEIQETLLRMDEEFANKKPDYPEELCFLTGDERQQYLHDMNICQQYANKNRETIANIILSKMFNTTIDNYQYFQTIHNYINFDDNIIRKGSISAKLNERVLIPINMRDGSILAIGKGNDDWNNSAPHGAGRVLSRMQAKKTLCLDEFNETMKDVYTTSVSEHTLDEAPMAYKPMEDIVKHIKDTVEIVDHLKPVYNFKA